MGESASKNNTAWNRDIKHKGRCSELRRGYNGGVCRGKRKSRCCSDSKCICDEWAYNGEAELETPDSDGEKEQQRRIRNYKAAFGYRDRMSLWYCNPPMGKRYRLREAGANDREIFHKEKLRDKRTSEEKPVVKLHPSSSSTSFSDHWIDPSTVAEQWTIYVIDEILGGEEEWLVWSNEEVNGVLRQYKEAYQQDVKLQVVSTSKWGNKTYVSLDQNETWKQQVKNKCKIYKKFTFPKEEIRQEHSNATVISSPSTPFHSHSVSFRNIAASTILIPTKNELHQRNALTPAQAIDPLEKDDSVHLKEGSHTMMIPSPRLELCQTPMDLNGARASMVQYAVPVACTSLLQR
eukprot:CAMPEP_0185276494 /NCGR_PEP_ID=MMETSP1359-20130426/56290_1 /TAXON_ID=552665 /ORGANISM="Bigelowiella longifila, Strain CCMP242" /LENGTH=348 /DNA_ID=CAMNT_0027870179 /DNA_START=156 /DNA_END=1202 /DNA_ORIENTATION=+